MPRFSSGVHVEDRLVALLERFGCRVQRDEILDHRHLLDFVVLELPEFQALLPQPIGVQVTGRLNDADKQRRFQQRVESSPYTRKNFYVEIERENNLERGGAFALLVAIADYALDRQSNSEGVRGLRIFADNTFEFFALASDAEAVTRSSLMLVKAGGSAAAVAAAPAQRTPGAPVPAAEAPSVAPAPLRPTQPGPPNPVMGQRLSAALGRPVASEAPRLTGVVARYNPSNLMGVIRSAGGQEYFLHRNNIDDESLRSLLERIADEGGQWIADRDVKVSFRDGGKPYGKKNHIAQGIRTEASEPESDLEF